MRIPTDTKWRQIIIAVAACLLVWLAWRGLPNPAVAFVIAIVPLAVIGVFRAPVLVVLLFVCFSFFRLHEAFPLLYQLKIPKLLSLAAISVLFWNIFIAETIKPYWRFEFTTLTIFIVLITVGVPLATNVPEAQNYYTQVYSKIVLMLFIVAWLLREEKDFLLGVRMIVISGVAIAYVAIFNKLNGIGLVEETRVTIGREIDSSLGDPNDLSSVLQFPLSFAVAFVLTPRTGFFNRVLGLLGILMLMWAILATQSRGALLGVMSVFGLYGWRYVKNKLLFIGGGGLAAMVLYVAAGVGSRKTAQSSDGGLDTSSEQRLHAWEAAIGMATAYPIFGVGLHCYYSNYYAFTPKWDGLNHAVHSTWFGVLAESGYIGFIFFITLFVGLIRSGIRNMKTVDRHAGTISPAVSVATQGALMGLVGTAVSGSFLTMGFTWPIYIAAAFVISIAQFLEDSYGAQDGKAVPAAPQKPSRLERLRERLKAGRAKR
ncbi:O-antigen ligase family protein [uncultured Thiodictyon sp.]|jgi:O-antigen ligase|uniref:O-antigen ligase family protein n=1 Tax=uncultured Thiodictyon sp. TaxID=1846217 RepID=UPI0025EA10CF|nr:O-antigen ligase family protein [uncultured Thiodictyon sp.]